MKTYRVGKTRYYRDGVTYEEGDVVTIPATEEPHPEWTPLTKKEAEKVQEEDAKVGEAPRAEEDKAEGGKKGNRPSDRRL